MIIFNKYWWIIKFRSILIKQSKIIAKNRVLLKKIKKPFQINIFYPIFQLFPKIAIFSTLNYDLKLPLFLSCFMHSPRSHSKHNKKSPIKHYVSGHKTFLFDNKSGDFAVALFFLASWHFCCAVGHNKKIMLINRWRIIFFSIYVNRPTDFIFRNINLWGKKEINFGAERAFVNLVIIIKMSIYFFLGRDDDAFWWGFLKKLFKDEDFFIYGFFCWIFKELFEI